MLEVEGEDGEEVVPVLLAQHLEELLLPLLMVIKKEEEVLE